MKIIYFFLLLMAFGLHRYSQNNGMGMTFDSLNYLHASKTWQKEKKLVNHNQSNYVVQTPLFPIILSIFDTKNGIFISYFFSFCLIFTLILYFFWIDFIFDNYFIKIMTAFCISIGTPLYLVHHFLWSEPFFLLLLTINSFSFYVIISDKECFFSKKMLYFFFFLSGFLLCLQRNTGIFFLFGELFFLIFMKRNELKKYFFLIFLTFLSLSGWFFWTYFSVKDIGNTQQFFLVFMEGAMIERLKSIDFLNKIIFNWLFPFNSFWLRFLFTSFFLIFLILFIIKNKIKITLSLQIMIFLSSFYVLILSSFPLQFSDAERYLSVIFPFFVIIFFYFLSIIIKKYAVLKTFLFIFLLLFISYNAIRTVKNVHFWQLYKGDF